MPNDIKYAEITVSNFSLTKKYANPMETKHASGLINVSGSKDTSVAEYAYRTAQKRHHAKAIHL